ncbi:MAG: ASCH domain-containing protein [Bacilli bacterium]|nr:ASCH domain-containing protein [Bacilli bacterium]
MSIILMSIKPEYVDKIFSGEKKYEYRKRLCKENIDTIIVYSSSPIQKVVGELKIKQVLYDKKNVIWNKTNKYGGITKIKYDNYYENCGYVVAYEIEKAILYDKQKDLKDFNVRTAPQSYVYITNKGVDPNE